MPDFRELGLELFDLLVEKADSFELTSNVFVAEEVREGEDRIELRPRSSKMYKGAHCLSCKVEEEGILQFKHYIFYSATEDASWRAKRRLDCAHELGHIVLHNDMLRKEDDWTEVHEVEADWFALCLLQMHGYVNKRWSFEKRRNFYVIMEGALKAVKP